eukprot:6951412-Prymnesium_polylepis.1
MERLEMVDTTPGALTLSCRLDASMSTVPICSALAAVAQSSVITRPTAISSSSARTYTFCRSLDTRRNLGMADGRCCRQRRYR